MAVAFAMATAPSRAAVVWQYEGEGASSNEWRAAKAGSSLVALHGASNGWVSAEVRIVGQHKAVGFGEGASAFAFQSDATNRVAVVYAVVRNNEVEELATLLEAPRNVCVRLASSWQWETSWHWQTEQLGFRAGYRVNGKATSRFEPSDAFQLVEVRFETRPEMRELFVGNAAASPLWLRHWRGEIGELLFFTRELTEQEQHAVYNYLRLKWGVPLSYERVGAAGILDSLEIRRGSLFGTIFMTR
jgi:hypothetical protein